MDTILKPLTEDLRSLYDNDIIQSAKQLNESFERNFISEKQLPMYFTGKYDAKTVFVMLNPGKSDTDCFSFQKCKKNEYHNFDTFFDSYLKKHINYGIDDSSRMDNFDLKQAAFLYEFKESGIEIPNFFDESKKENAMKLKAKERVLMEKLQLELIPYCSVSFFGILDTEKQAVKNIEFLLPHINRVFDSILSFERKYVIFGSKQFAHLFEAYKKYGKVQFWGEKNQKIELENDLKLANKVSWNTVTIMYKGKKINAIIPYSFPRRDLPNAYPQMREYGRLCYNEFIMQFGN